MGVLTLVMVLAIVSTGSVMADPVSAATIPVTAGSTNAQIQALIDNAHSGDTISFAPGTYNDINLTINKTLNLIGNGAVLNSININNSVIFTITASGDVEGSGTTIQGFELKNLNSSFSSSTGYSILLDKVSNIVISNVTTHDGKSGIYSSCANNVLIKNCSLYCQYDNNKQSRPYAVNIMGGNNITLQNSTISGANDGISMASGATNVYVINNIISNCSYAAFWGGGISNITIANNLINNWSVEG